MVSHPQPICLPLPSSEWSEGVFEKGGKGVCGENQEDPEFGDDFLDMTPKEWSMIERIYKLDFIKIKKKKKSKKSLALPKHRQKIKNKTKQKCHRLKENICKTYVIKDSY